MNTLVPKPGRGRCQGFTLVEMLVAVTILTLIMVLATQMIGATSKLWKNTTAKIEAFQGARDGFQLMTDELRQATLNTYWDYFDASGRTSKNFTATTFTPVAYGRQSELHFRIAKSLVQDQVNNTYGVFFQAPLGYTAAPALYGNLQNLLNATGFYVEQYDGTQVMNAPPSFLPTNATYRPRLMQFIQPTENMTVYNYSYTNSTAATAWFSTVLSNPSGNTAHASYTRIVASNIIGLIIWAKGSDSATDLLTSTGAVTSASPPGTFTYSYDSRLGLVSAAAIPTGVWIPGTNPQPLQMNQMPPILHIAMVAMDEPSAKVLIGSSTLGLNAPPTKINTAYSGLFTDPRSMDTDLLTLQTGTNGLASIKPHINYRVFETTLAIKSARFSTQ